MDSIWTSIIFWAIALTGSIFYASWGFQVHMVDEDTVDSQKENKKYAWLIHQWWFNFIGCLTGWVIIWILLPVIVQGVCYQNVDSFQFIDFILLITGLLGITGHLPMTLFGIAISSNAIINKVFKL